jgi:hypothetical protein
MNRSLLFVPFVVLAATTGCESKSSKSDHGHAHGSATHEHKPAPPDATAVAVAKTASGPFTLALTPAGELAPGKPAPLTLALQDAAGTPVTALDVVHEKLLHLIVVSPDLSFFSHLHPEARPDGTYTAELTAPAPATYVAFADFKPTGAAQSVARGTLAVPGDAAAPVALEAKALPARGTFDGFEVSLRSKAPLVAGADAVLEFEITQKGAAVADLQNHLGARGHCIIISEDTSTFLHSHPLGGTGAKVQFHTTIPAAGKYKVWGEFRPAGKPLLASFVLDVPAELAAPKEEPHGHSHGKGKGHDHGTGGHTH